jgi:outer membrane protein assembly factor BamB
VTSGAVVAYKLDMENGKAMLQPAWVSANIPSPKAPIVVNGVVFALAGGSAAAPAVLHALQGATGKSLWSSGQTITSYADAGLSASQGQVYVAAHDHTFYAFGFYVPTDQ